MDAWTDPLEQLRRVLADRYQVEREVGSGGMATVYLAEDLRYRRKVAVKVLRPELAATLGAERFLREIEVASQLQHPHILPLLDSGDAGGVLYYVMPFVEGPSLRERMAEGALIAHDAIRILMQVVDALAEAHRKGIVHRDVKPDNVLMSGRHAVVTDFGVAKAVTDATGMQNLTTVGVALGTPAYMSPEQAAADTHIDHRSDIYSVGVMAYEMLTGSVLFARESSQAVLAAHISEEPERLRARQPAVSLTLEAVVLKCLAKKPEARWQTAEELLRELESFYTPSGGITSPRAVVTALSQAVRRPRGAMLAGGLVFAVVAIGLSLWNSRANTRWATELAIPLISTYADSGEWDSAYALARDVQRVVPHHPQLHALWHRFSWLISMDSDPPGAKVFRRPYLASDSDWEALGTTPLRDVHFPFGYSVVRVELAGHAPIVRALGRPLEGGRMVLDTFRLDRETVVPPGMVPIPGLPNGRPFPLEDYFLGGHEVTNREFSEFIAAGGYEKQEFWEHPITDAGREIPWAQAITLFTDQTGRPGPSTWEAGDYHEGQAAYPVGGVSWYEAAAYARFVNAELPTVEHWRFALGAEDARWIWPASNLDADSPAPVGKHQGITWTGVYDMVGNVREWAFNARGDQRFIMGGGWTDESAFFNPLNIQSWRPPLDRSPTNGIRLAITHDDSVARVHWRRPLTGAPPRDVKTEPVASADSLEAFRRMYDYDAATPLRPTTESVDSTRIWIRERVLFDAGYGGERMVVYLYLPRTADPPYQTLVYWPGAPAFFLDSIGQYRTDHLEFVLKSGRALAYPVYVNTFERRRRAPLAFRQRVLLMTTDLRRTIDYLATRPDIDSTKFTYYGYSNGGGYGPIVLAVEPRFRAAVLYMAGLWPGRSRFSEIEPATFLSSVRLPVIMFSGQLDDGFPLETSAKPFFRMLGTPDQDKRHVIAPGSHFVDRPVLIRETLDFLDRYLGPVRSSPQVVPAKR